MSDKQGAPTLPPLTGGGGNNGGSNGGAPQQTISLQQVFANVLSSANVQQFVLTSQVPGLSQVIPNSGTGTAQPIGVTRIVNISSSAPRVSVVNVSGPGGVTSPSRPNNPKLVLTTSPKLVRSMFVTPTPALPPTTTAVSSGGTSSLSPSASPPAKKKARLSESNSNLDKPTEPAADAIEYRRRIIEHKLQKMRAIRDKYNENVAEYFFLQNGGNIMDFNNWRKKPTPQFLEFMKQHKIDSDDNEEEFLQIGNIVTAAATATTTTTTTVAAAAAPITTTTIITTTATVTTTTFATAATTTTTVSTTTSTVAATTTTTVTTTSTMAVTTSPSSTTSTTSTTSATTQVPSMTTTTTTSTTMPTPLTTTTTATNVTQSTEVAVSGGTPVAVSTTLPPAVVQLSQQGGTPMIIDSPEVEPPVNNPIAEKMIATTAEKPATPPISSSQPIVKLVKLSPASITSSCDTVSSNQEQIVEKAKQEAYVMQRIAELQREGLWTERRLPKIQEPPRPKAHWDYLLEEMVWLSTDFAQERKWKKAAAKKCARMVQKYFQEKAIQAQKAEKLEELRLKKIAGFIAKEIKTFWANVEKVVEFKQQTRLEEKRKKALDQHLNFIVDQTEKYSSWLTEGLNKVEGIQSTPASIHSSRISSPNTTAKNSDDDEFKPNQDSDDDEETIAKAEEEMKSNHKEEVELLKKESELPLEDLLAELPPNYLEERDKSLSPLPKDIVEDEEESVNAEGKDTEFTVASDASTDDEEDTIQEQEKLEKNVDHKQEIADLEAENQMPIDALIAKYGNASVAPMDVDEDDSEDEESDKDENDENESESEEESESEDETQDDSQTQSDEEQTVGLKSLFEDLSDENKSTSEASEKQNEMDSVAAIAESIQPKGNTLQTTHVVTKIPFLLKHSLREYQHIGLDWLVTMYERKLNGILADEMGLGKTIQTIALLAHLACEKGNWGPHLVVVPTSVMLNWEMECKKWCPGFKILTYYGTQKERKQKRTGWTKPNAFHICITSYKLVIQDHQSFRRKKWKYLILDEAQNIKNFKSQRWQLLLNFQTQRRLLLTGTPLQNNLMELWSLMHFLMPNVFQSHREFKEWFSNPVTGMIEGNNEYNENIIRRLHKVLRPFLLRRLKCEVEKQLPKKYEHVLMCRLSKRQRYLYDDFMSRAKTKETLASGNLLCVINVLMQLRKVCNHPNLFEPRPTVSPFQMEGIDFHTASLAWSALDYDPFKHIDLSCLNLLLLDLEFVVTAFVAHRIRRLKTPRKLIEEIDSQPETPPRCPVGKIRINVRLSNQVSKTASTNSQQSLQQPIKLKSFSSALPTPRVGTSPLVKNNQTPPGQSVTLKVAGGQQLQGISVQLVPHQGGVKAIPVGTVAQNIQSTASVTPTTTSINTQRITVSNVNVKDGQKLTMQTYTVKTGDSVQKYQGPNIAQLVQTSTGKHIILTNPQQSANALSFPIMTPSGQRLTVLSKQIMGLSTTPVPVNKVIGGVVTTSSGGTRPVMRVPPLNVNTAQSSGQVQSTDQIRVTKTIQKDSEKGQIKEVPKSEFYLPHLEEIRKQKRQSKLITLADINERRCSACPLYGDDLFTALRIEKPVTTCNWQSGWLHCAKRSDLTRSKKQYFSRTKALCQAIKSTEQIVENLKEILEKFVIYVPAARAPLPQFHVSHPNPSKHWKEQRLVVELNQQLSSKVSMFHSITRSMLTQFPDPRLIQYDCGKLQSLDILLRQLKFEGHRVLIFTQMTRMLDVFEAFLNYHGHIYLRLDGATKIDQRQVLMERFNNDKRIFCFILSTRSGGVGVNLTGADTVIFYDSDWNPTMDAQAQDRCHRIGQTRDVHIYRLISERTVEENILRKANQKRLLGDLAIEGGNFTTAYFKSSTTIQDLFDVDQNETDASTRMAEVLDQSKERERNLQRELSQTEDKTALGALESAIAEVEEDQDVQAAKSARAEAVADLAEFDENIPVDEFDNDNSELSKAEMEVQSLVSQLTPVERYAMRFVENSDGNFSAAVLAAAERELEEQKKEWELDRLRAMREEEERQARMTDDDENPLTFSREDAQNQVNTSVKRSVGRPPRGRRGRGRPICIDRRRFNPGRRPNACREVEEDEAVSTESDNESETSSVSISDSENDNVDAAASDGTGSESESDQSNKKEDGWEDNDQDEGGKKKVSFKNVLLDKNKRNHVDINSPRTRSRGDVKIDLWTLDVNPLLPEVTRPRAKKTKANTSIESIETKDKGNNSTSESFDNTGETLDTMSVNIIENVSASLLNESPTNEPMKSVLDDTIKRLQDTESIDRESNPAPTVSTPQRGRPRKQVATVESSSSTTVPYSTRSTSGKVVAAATPLPLAIPLQEKRAATSQSSNCEDENKVCDINDTSNPQNKENKEGKSKTADSVVRPNATVISEKKFDTDEQTEAESKNSAELISIDEQPHSPVFTRKFKLTRSRIRSTESKDKQFESAEQVKSDNTETNEIPMEVDVSIPKELAADSKIIITDRSSPILSTRRSKITRSNNHTSPNTKQEFKSEEARSVDKIGLSIVESAKESESSLARSTRSSTRSITDDKLKEKSIVIYEALTESAKLKNIETPVTIVELDKISAKKSDEEQLERNQTKITRSFTRSSIGIVDSASLEQVKVSTAEKIKTVETPTKVERAKSPERVVILPAEKSVKDNEKPSESQGTEEPKPKVETSTLGMTTRRKASNVVEDTLEMQNIESMATETQTTPAQETPATTAPTSPEYPQADVDSRSTRSNIQLPNPMYRRTFGSPTKPDFRRRPDTPMPDINVRPRTRSLSNVSDGDIPKTLSPRSSRTDNGFVVPTLAPVAVRRARSLTYVKMSDRISTERKDLPISIGTATRGVIRDPTSGESVTINRVVAKNRPDTPMPTQEQVTRFGKPSTDSHTLSPKSLPPIPKLKRPLSLPPPTSTQQAELNDSTDSNGNSLDSSIESTSQEKPQRTAKVVCQTILNLDSKSKSRATSSPPQKTSPMANNVKSGRGPGRPSKAALALDDHQVVEFDSESEYNTATRAKRTRLSSQLVKPLNKPKDLHTIDLDKL
ncbi:helicase domino isoform X2 [Phymastichus coffea]|uniref:helicase domino isoform X2 n=1 Tax=Phymastichus coffea TaxID=108790 RepID=UPI00273B7049|nr:helicase domino isoform X2 [Phymastichus coffea]